MLRASKKLRDNPCYTVQFSGNLSRNGIASQVAEKIAQCNRALIKQYNTRSISINQASEKSFN